MVEGKRMLDIVVAGAGLVVAAPVLAALAIVVKLDSPGPALFVQTRVGRGRRPIRVPKLRTMIASAEARGPQITSSSDTRITRLGNLLRRTKLDELPQLWSVMRGDMSLVGPRPEVERYVAMYRPEWLDLFTVRPGLTDPASLVFRREEELLAAANDRERAYIEVIMPLKADLALRGVYEQSVRTDLGVIARTVLALVRSGGEDDPVLVEARRRIAELNRDPS